MVELLGAVGLFASIIQIADALTRLSSEFRRFVHTVKYAPQEVKYFHRDLSNFSASLRWFHRISKSCLAELEKDGSPMKKERELHIAGVVKECEVVEDGFAALLNKFLGNPATHTPHIASPVDRLRWYFRKPSVVGLKLSLESAKSTVELFMTLHISESLHKEILELQKASKEVSEDLKRQLHFVQQQLKEQTKASKDRHKQLIEHLDRMRYSAPILIPGIRSVLVETRALERNATRSLRQENRKIRQGLSSERQPPKPPRRNSSPETGSSVPEPHTPRPSPSAPNSNHVISTQISSPAPQERIELLPYYGSTRQIPRTWPEEDENEAIRTAQIDPILPGLCIRSKSRSPSSRPRDAPGPDMNGSVIDKNRNEIAKSVGRPRSEASAMSTTSPYNPTYIVKSSLSSLRKEDQKLYRKSPAPHTSEGSKRQATAKPEVELMDGVKRSSIAGASPYRAVPPFRTEDWKGVRRRPSN
ncbi:hypothetical protein PMIN02_008705 [Paraphaeosphaeria minitans]|uniref:Fungal N-terminal domain-containing protein n=1 Tax=Paraphaeosphaeria minitans TaxID=565426 RepID=A0A9P6GJN4_9PLEO|nr:hypothetical protein PMIN01_07010 [Paraphaeosphaeria minitans]